MRIYQHGKMIPMDKVTWQILCQPQTIVCWNEDLDIDFNEHVKRAREKAFSNVVDLLQIKIK